MSDDRKEINNAEIDDPSIETTNDAEDINPYQVSQSQLRSSNVLGGSVWREGKKIVMLKEGALPNRCIKCNAAATKSKDTRLFYVTPWVYIALLLNILICAILVLILRKQARVEIPLCDHHNKIRIRNNVIAYIGLFIAIGMVIIGAASDLPALLAIGSLMIIGLIIYALFNRLVVASKIDNEYVWIKGASDAFLAELQPFVPPIK